MSVTTGMECGWKEFTAGTGGDEDNIMRGWVGMGMKLSGDGWG